MKNKYLILVIVVILVAVSLIFTAIYVTPSSHANTPQTTTSSVKFVNSTITATGAVVAQARATLNFQTSGKLMYLPFKEGDAVTVGKTIARLDTYALQRQLTTALNNYRSNRNTFDQTQQNAQDNVLKTQIAPTYVNENAFDKSVVVDDALKRIVDQSQSSLDNSVINVELANYALQLSTLTSPLTGIITHEDVTLPGVNITPATTFSVADLKSIVFRANIPMENIYYVSEGSSVSLAIDGFPDRITGTVVKIYPSKVTLANGSAVYQIDVQSDQLVTQGKLDQTGTAIISTNSQNVALVPAWTILGGKYIWVNVNNTPHLKQVTIGKIHGNEIEIISGLTPSDQIIIDPRSIPASKYQIL